MVTFFIIYRGNSVETALPLAVCTTPKIIAGVAQLIIEDIPKSETSDSVTLMKRVGLTQALEELQKECSQ